MTPKEMEKLIKADGWKLDHIKGSHHHYKHLKKLGIVTIPFHDRPKDLKQKTVASILKQAGLK